MPLDVIGLSGQHGMSAGVASVSGHDIATDLPSIYADLGVCPQFDALFDLLSAEGESVCDV